MPDLQATDGTRLFYKDLGRGPAVLFVHAWSLDSSMWEYQVVALLEAGYRCIALDRRGHGRSDVASAGYDLDSLAGDLATLIDRLVLSGTITPGPGTAGAALAERTIAELRADRPGWFRAGADAYFALPESGISPAQTDDTLVHILQPPLEVQEACVRTMFTLDATDELRELDVPVLPLHGDRDASAPLEITARPTAALLPRSELRVYAGAGHGLYVTHRDRFHRDLLDFFASWSR